ncbi:MAG: galactosyldiacylglycerol synthase [Clostridia bacterium]|nr:galactosyldiacylglycerol synthase [Clostridia bacterium]
MKVVILSASTGGGHMSASNNIRDYLESKNISVKVIDAIEYISPLLNKTVNEIYSYIAVKQPRIWKLVYNTSNNYRTVNKIILSINNIISRKLLPLIESENPDVIITTHPFTTEMISNLKIHRIINIPLMCVMTDYASHRTWINPKVDAYIVSNSDMIPSMEKLGVNKNIIYPFGIPIDDSFYVKNTEENKKNILKELGLNPELNTVLIMAGKGGFANIDEIYCELQDINLDFQIIVITGKNEYLYNKIKLLSQGKIYRTKREILRNIRNKLKFRKIKLRKKLNISKIKKTKIIYFTNEVEKYMSVSDLIITKPGGLTVSEALACKLPMALFNAIPGQEEENANFLVNNNMAIKLENTNISKTIENLLSNPVKLNYMKKSCENFDKSDSLKNILDILYKITAQEKIYNKLVRDKIPEIIINQNNIPEYKILDNNNYNKYLKQKLLEEAQEVINSKNISELKSEISDVLEVIYMIMKNSNISHDEIEKIRQEKNLSNGSFEKKIFLKKIKYIKK